MANQKVIRNPALNEFTWDLLYNITPEQKKRLSIPYLRILGSSVRTKNFCEFSTLDEKVRLFSELGLDNAIVFFQDKKVPSVNALKVILDKYDQNKQAGASAEIAKLKVFVSSDKTIRWLLGMMADTIHHKSYFMNLEYNRLGFHIKNWGKDRNTPESLQLKETIESQDLLVKTFLNVGLALDYSDGVLGMGPLDMKILMYINRYRHTYIEKNRIYDFFDTSTTKGKITTSIKRLFLTEHIKKHIDYSVPRYTLTGLGVEKLNQFISYVLKQNEF